MFVDGPYGELMTVVPVTEFMTIGQFGSQEVQVALSSAAETCKRITPRHPRDISGNDERSFKICVCQYHIVEFISFQKTFKSLLTSRSPVLVCEFTKLVNFLLECRAPWQYESNQENI